MIILGLDPGSRCTGFGVVEMVGGRADRLRALAHGRLAEKARRPLPARLDSLTRGLEELLSEWRPEAVALETPFHGINSRSLIVLAQARGALLATLARQGLEIREYSPAEVKSAVSGNGRADKDQVARMVRIILGLERAVPSRDATDALAVAICCAHRFRVDLLTAPESA